MPSDVLLLGRAIIEGSIRALTGLHIGGSGGALAIGALDNPVVRDPLTRRPYVPGSSLRGKMRSLVERRGKNGRPYEQTQRIGQGVHIHVCQTEGTYADCDVCHVFGIPAQAWNGPTRLIVRDTRLSEESARDLEEARTDQPYTEVKSEVAIDRVTSAATPRTLERVPAGAVFAPLELTFGFYEAADLDRFFLVLDALDLVEEDALGGSGSRGSGRVQFESLAVRCRAGEESGPTSWDTRAADLADLRARRPQLRAWLAERLKLGPA